MSQEFKKDQRVAAHPATDAFVKGDRYGVVTLVGRKWIHVKMDRSGRVLKFSPENLTIPRQAPTPPRSAIGRKCFYLPVEGPKVEAVVEDLDCITHPSRYNLRVTDSSSLKYRKGQLINTPPAFVQAI